MIIKKYIITITYVVDIWESCQFIETQILSTSKEEALEEAKLQIHGDYTILNYKIVC